MESPKRITGYPPIDIPANHFLSYLTSEDRAKLRRELERAGVQVRADGGTIANRHAVLHKLREIMLGGFLAVFARNEGLDCPGAHT
jgi:hypothetical protein